MTCTWLDSPSPLCVATALEAASLFTLDVSAIEDEVVIEGIIVLTPAIPPVGPVFHSLEVVEEYTSE
jgi:hypothetical protein